MRKIGILFLSCVFSFMVFGPGFCVERFMGINPRQPVAPGGMIYYDETMRQEPRAKWLDYAQYTYLGMENQSLRVKYLGKNDVTGEAEEDNQITVPVNERGQAFLSVNRASSDTPPINLSIKVVDKSNNITVEYADR